MDLKTLELIAANCVECELHIGRTNAVFARGNQTAGIMICGMVPGPDENLAGSPFVGRAGKLLDQILEDSRISQDDVYITNAVKCALRPGIPLTESWIAACLPYIVSQIALIKPKVIVTLGADSTNALLGFSLDTKIGANRGKVLQYADDIFVVPTYHPSYLLRGGGRQHKHYNKVLNDFDLAAMVLNDKNVKVNT